MLRPDLFDRYDMERRIHERLFCFGSDSADEDSGGGSDVSDEDLDESLQQDIAAAAVQQRSVGLQGGLVRLRRHPAVHRCAR